MREGWGWEMQGSSSSPGDAGGVGDVSIVAVGEGGAGVGDVRVVVIVDTGCGVVGWVMG